jgi:hypothetical protein
MKRYWHPYLETIISLEWYELALTVLFSFVAKTSEVLVAAGLVMSTANFLTDGSIMTAHPGLATAWAWALFVGNRKEGEKQQRLTDRALNARVRTLGERVGLPTLSPHDCHVYWEQQRERTLQQQQATGAASGTGKVPALARAASESASNPSQQTTPQSEVPVTERPPRRPARPDILNRHSFEESMLRRGVPESMIAPYVSEYRLLIPLMVKHLDKETFLRQLQQDRKDLKLSQGTDEFWKQALEQIEHWMHEQLELYRITRQEK